MSYLKIPRYVIEHGVETRQALSSTYQSQHTVERCEISIFKVELSCGPEIW
jgi:hypothetical protein